MLDSIAALFCRLAFPLSLSHPPRKMKERVRERGNTPSTLRHMYVSPPRFSLAGRVLFGQQKRERAAVMGGALTTTAAAAMCEAGPSARGKKDGGGRRRREVCFLSSSQRCGERERGVPLQLILVDYCTRCALGFQSGFS